MMIVETSKMKNTLETFRMQMKDLYDNERNMCKDAQRW
jgi:hypothetical protein